jgi:ribosomal-protein-alanine N-acetyltransferase
MLNNSSDAQKIFPTIDLGDFYLREKRDLDAEDFFRYYSDCEVNKFILCDIPKTLEEAKMEINYWRNIFYRNDGIYFAIAKKNNDQLIGSIGLTGYNSYQHRIEISYDLAKEYWNLGIMTKAIKAVAHYGFTDFFGKVNRIEAFVAKENIISKNLLLKCGFELEGLLRQHRYHKENFVDVFIFSLLKKDFLTKFENSYKKLI